jgi:hypothetical protein
LSIRLAGRRLHTHRIRPATAGNAAGVEKDLDWFRRVAIRPGDRRAVATEAARADGDGRGDRGDVDRARRRAAGGKDVRARQLEAVPHRPGARADPEPHVGGHARLPRGSRRREHRGEQADDAANSDRSRRAAPRSPRRDDILNLRRIAGRVECDRHIEPAIRDGERRRSSAPPPAWHSRRRETWRAPRAPARPSRDRAPRARRPADSWPDPAASTR